MYKVVSIDPKTKIECVHWYSTSNEAENAAFALYSFPLFKRKTTVLHKPNAHITYESGE